MHNRQTLNIYATQTIISGMHFKFPSNSETVKWMSPQDIKNEFLHSHCDLIYGIPSRILQSFPFSWSILMDSQLIYLFETAIKANPENLEREKIFASMLLGRNFSDKHKRGEVIQLNNVRLYIFLEVLKLFLNVKH